MSLTPRPSLFRLGIETMIIWFIFSHFTAELQHLPFLDPNMHASSMCEIGNISNLDLENYCISFCSWYININNYCMSFLKMLPFEVRNVKIKSIQFDTIQYKMVPFQDISKLYSQMFQFSICNCSLLNI
jgi:hypothetical protein